MKSQNIFKRYEIKYLVTDEQRGIIERAMDGRVKPDAYGKSAICNIYFDTPDYYLIRRSLEHPIYKEKLRVRSYGRVSHDDSVFIELKKKYDSVVYKRRINAAEHEAMAYLCNGGMLQKKSQIGREIDYFCSLYNDIKPKMFISYEREAFYAVDDDDFRVTFDRNIAWRDYDLSLTKGVYGTRILPSGMSLMELKTASSIPLWLVSVLSENCIYKTSFSKYGSAYLAVNNVGKNNFTEAFCYA